MILTNICYLLYNTDNLLLLEAETIKRNYRRTKKAYPCRNYIRGVFYLLGKRLSTFFVTQNNKIISYD